MKKLITLSFAALLIGCVNPSMEEGFENLRERLAEVEAELTPIVNGIQADMAEITATVAEITATMDDMADNTTGALATIAEINATLDNIGVELEKKLTKEQLAAFAEQVEDLAADIDMLVFLADYDYDGVMNGLDQCPDTPIMEIADVNANGCSPSQLDD